jgi:hypothetical protein
MYLSALSASSESPHFQDVRKLKTPQTFFQSGVFQWADREITGNWFFRTDVFGLFMAICVPMTVLTLLGWVVVSTLAKAKARKMLAEESAAGEAVARPRGLPV